MRNKLFSFENKVTAIVLLILVMVVVTGIFTYFRFAEIVATINTNTPTESKLIATESLIKNITKAENSAKSYSLTNDTIHLAQFYKNTNQAIDNLSELIDEEESLGLLAIDLDTLESLITEKFRILNQLLFLQDPFRVQEALNKVTIELEKSYSEEKLKEKSNIKIESIKEVKPIYRNKTNEDQFSQEQEEIKVEKKKKKRKRLFAWLFKGNNTKNEIKAEVFDEPKLIRDTIQPSDTTFEVYTNIIDTIEEVTLKDVNLKVKKVTKEEKGIERILKANELKLISEDREVSLKIQSILDLLKSNELNQIASNNTKIELKVKRTNQQVLIFCIALATLLFAMGLILINYARNNRGYRSAMKKAKLKAEEFAESKSQFLANMSHEIRTPMNAIIGFSEQISKSDLSENQRNQLNIIQNSADHLLHLVNDVLDFSKLERGKLSLEKTHFDLIQLIEDTLLFVKPMLLNKKLTINTNLVNNIPKFILGDAYRLRQVLLNLLSNAIKFTENGKIELSVHVLKQDTDRLNIQFTIKDSGIGMTKVQTENVFKEFEQVQSGTNKIYGGTGLGLSICKMIVDLHGGKMKLISTLNKGTSVIFEIPYQIVDHKSDFATKTVEYDINILNGHSLLIADDEPFNRLLLANIIKKYSGKQKQVTNGLEVIKEIKQNTYDLILMDARMPEMNGIEASIIIRDLNITTPIVALSAAIMEHEKESYKKAGMSYFIAKPFKEAELLDIVCKALKIKRSETK